MREAVFIRLAGGFSEDDLGLQVVSEIPETRLTCRRCSHVNTREPLYEEGVKAANAIYDMTAGGWFEGFFHQLALRELTKTVYDA